MKKPDIKNINKPTSAFWGKIAVAAGTASAALAGLAYIADVEVFKYVSGILAIIGSVIPPFMSDGENDNA